MSVSQMVFDKMSWNPKEMSNVSIYFEKWNFFEPIIKEVN
jgi:hypothetical protein